MRLGTKVESNKLTAKCVMMNDIVSRTRNLNFLALGPPQARLIIENSKYVAPVFFGAYQFFRGVQRVSDLNWLRG